MFQDVQPCSDLCANSTALRGGGKKSLKLLSDESQPEMSLIHMMARAGLKLTVHCTFLSAKQLIQLTRSKPI